MLVPVERTGVGEHLAADLVAVAVHVRHRIAWRLVHECCGFLPEHRDVRGLFHLHHGTGEVRGQLAPVGEGSRASRRRRCKALDR
jgi:hypothetical protein